MDIKSSVSKVYIDTGESHKYARHFSREPCQRVLLLDAPTEIRSIKGDQREPAMPVPAPRSTVYGGPVYCDSPHLTAIKLYIHDFSCMHS